MPKKHTFLPYTKARAFARLLRLKNRTEWQHYAKSHTAELEAAGVPRVPDVYYLSPQAKYERGYGYKEPTDPATANIGAWVDWHDWLGSSYAPRLNAQFLTSAEFVAFLKQKRITTQAQYQRWRKNAANRRTPLYSRLPGAPAIYKEFSWKQVSPTTRPTRGRRPRNKGGAVAQDYAPFGDVRRKVRALKLVKKKHWVTFVKDNPDWLREHRCPRHPESVAQYRPRWHSWVDFLGSDTRANRRYKRD